MRQMLHLRQERGRDRGATLLELVLYVGGASLVLIGVLALLTLLTHSWVRGRAQAVVEENVRISIERMRAEIEASQSVFNPTPVVPSGDVLDLSVGSAAEGYSGYAWSGGADPANPENQGIGWISLSCAGQTDPWDCDQPDNVLDNYRVVRSLDTLSGFALACPDPDGSGPLLCATPSGIVLNCRSSDATDRCAVADYRVTVDASGDYHGWAWGEVIGWISFNCADRGGSVCANSPYKVYETKTMTGAEVHGWAWSENYGWISFNCAERGLCDSGEPNYKATVGFSQETTRFDVSGGALRITTGGGTPQNLTDPGAVLIGKCDGWGNYFTLVSNPAPARPVVQACFKATYTGIGAAVLGYWTEIRSTFQLR